MERSQDSGPAAGALEQEIARLYESEAPGMRRYASAMLRNAETAQDALQEAFFRFFIARSAGQQFHSPKAWLYRVVRNYILDQKRSFARNEIGIELALDLPSPVREQADGVLSSGLLERAAQIGLTAREVECFRLRSEGLRYEDIASVLGLQSGTVGALLSRAHGKIRQAARGDGRQSPSFAMPLAREKRYAS